MLCVPDHCLSNEEAPLSTCLYRLNMQCHTWLELAAPKIFIFNHMLNSCALKWLSHSPKCPNSRGSLTFQCLGKDNMTVLKNSSMLALPIIFLTLIFHRSFIITLGAISKLLRMGGGRQWVFRLSWKLPKKKFISLLIVIDFGTPV